MNFTECKTDLDFVRYFYEKFAAIDKYDWCTYVYQDSEGRRCVLGHCGARNIHVTPEARVLNKLSWKYLNLSIDHINDGSSEIYNDAVFKLKHPQERILAALTLIIDKLQ